MHIVAVQLIFFGKTSLAIISGSENYFQSDIPTGSLIILPEMFDTGFSMNLDVTAQSVQSRAGNGAAKSPPIPVRCSRRRGWPGNPKECNFGRCFAPVAGNWFDIKNRTIFLNR